VGWRKAAGEIIAFTDDDCIPTPGWLRAGVAAFRPGVIGVSGRLVMPLSSAPTDYELNASYLERSEFVTANCFYRRADLERVSGFDERFAEAWREDSDLIFTLMERVQGMVRFVHAPDAVVIHPVRPAQWGVSLLQQRKNMYNALLYKKHPSLYRQCLGRVTPWHYYVILIALLVCFAGLLTRQPVLTLSAAMIWMALTGFFFLQRLERTSRAPQHVAEMAITSILIPPVALCWRAKGALKYRVWFL
jgi:GT2 family glycosyltransferase